MGTSIPVKADTEQCRKGHHSEKGVEWY